MVEFIRYFAATDGSPIGVAALGYLKSLCRIAPVRVISKTGGLVGPWLAYEELTMTPMVGTYVNCVCTHPSAWIWSASVPMPAENLGAMGAALATEAPKKAAHARGMQELYTAKVRNVLFVVEPPVSDVQRAAMLKYEGIVVKPRFFGDARIARGVYVESPVTDHESIRATVLGESPPPLERTGEG